MRYVVFVVLLGGSPAFADTALPTLGARAGALGGAFTAVADDVTAFHWNPAGIVAGPVVRIGFFGMAAFEDRGALVSHLGEGSPTSGAVLSSSQALGFSAELTLLGVAVTHFTYTRSSLSRGLLRSSGLQTFEVAGSFVHSLPPNDLTLGVNLRYVRGTAFEGIRAAASIDPAARSVTDLVEAATDGTGHTESEPAVDVGVLYEPSHWVRLGFAARNLNRPTFHTLSGREIGLERSARFGVALAPRRSVRVCFDVDLDARADVTGDPGIREIALGAEKTWRAGRYRLQSGIRGEFEAGALGRPAVSAGFGVTFKGVLVELSGSTGTERRHAGLFLGASLR